MGVVAQSCCLGQKSDVIQNKKASHCVVAQRRQDAGNNGVFLRCSSPTCPLWAHLHVGANHPAGQSSDQSCSFFSGPPKMRGETRVKGRAKHLEKPKSSLSLTTGCPLITNTGLQILHPSGASPHLRNSMTHACLLPRHSENKRQTDSMPKAQPFREQSGRVSLRWEGIKHPVSCCYRKISSNYRQNGAIAPSYTDPIQSWIHFL